MNVEKRPRKPTIRDVAVVAGVSYGTVSRVLNGGKWVSEDAREAVEAAIRQTGYTANHHARSLATGRSNSVAFLLTEPHHLLFEDPTYSLLLRYSAQALTSRGQTLVLLAAGTADEKQGILRYVEGGHVDGVMLVSSHESDPFVSSLLGAGVPTVCVGLPLGSDLEIPSVSVDEYGSAREMTRYLLSGGSTRIAHIAGPQDTPGGRFRLEGFRDEMGELFDASLVVEGDFSRASGGDAIASLAPGSFDAVFAASDSMAVGVIQRLQRSGVRVPDDVVVAGFDDSGLAADFEPSLTTMRQPWERIGEQMVAMLLEVIDGGAGRTLTLPTELVVRESAPRA
ncbi:transcriptional regulator [Microbacterium sorbitolivorans]|uniref:LacI family transcriptional regulator n=1 Tax=Microbacterium sorbitolivorans TaxID=1867410 RepID=A0A367YAK6_9MICO|nr:LacI family DNA-binding transcriptional regulator [Microbacterium sorbitolivorans]RCK62051.1 LacI family transcriptional regulator [Microbacterium sorbitolivorans]GGF43564.1 transcriptional regulator [Microbacterium sorbitolivorans]